MILTCPSCETQYFADDSTIGESGRTVKCAACGHNWFVRPEAALAASTGKAPAAHEVYREKVRQERRRKSRFASLLSWLVTAGIFFTLGLGAIIFRNDVVKVWPQAGSAYKQIGFDVNRFGLEFADIERARTFNDTVPVVTVTGKALNVARSDVDVPNVQVSLKDERGETVATRVGAITPRVLASGETGDFIVVLERAPMESFNIEVSFVDPSKNPVSVSSPESVESEAESELDTQKVDVGGPLEPIEDVPTP
jgi:predicted Zn finger-like uncharacterized protein